MPLGQAVSRQLLLFPPSIRITSSRTASSACAGQQRNQNSLLLNRFYLTGKGRLVNLATSLRNVKQREASESAISQKKWSLLEA